MPSYNNLADISQWYDPNNSQGETVWIALTPPLADLSLLGVGAVQTFYQQINDYNHISGQCSPGAYTCDDYTQMMWASSIKAGFGIVQECVAGEFLCTTYVVVRYSPKGKIYVQTVFQSKDIADIIEP